jgi:hypothetical protein
MRTLIAIFLAAFSTHEVIAATYDVGCGTFEAPDDCAFKHTGTLDSFMGTLTRMSDGFTIFFDIGQMAGIHMYPSKQDKCTFFRTHTINGNLTWTGLERGDGKQTVATTIYEHGERSRRFGEESSAILKLPAEERERKAQELNERRAQFPKDPPPPANFWADFTREADLAEFLLIVSTYKPKVQ